MRIAAILYLFMTKITLAANSKESIFGNGCITSDQLRSGDIAFDKIPCIIISISSTLLSFVGYISLGVILIGALMYVFGGVNEEFKSQGKTAIKMALVGAIVSWSSWLIVNFIVDNL